MVTTGFQSNELGPIARTYTELQALDVLAQVRNAPTLTPLSSSRTIRSLFQAAEIALLNLNDVLGRATSDLSGGDLTVTTQKLRWARSFHRILTRLGLLTHQIGFPEGPSLGSLTIQDSPAYQDHLSVLSLFDRQVQTLIDAGTLNLESVLAETIDPQKFDLLHLIRICNHESLIWESKLTDVTIETVVNSYAQFVAADGIRRAVHEFTLQGDTFFTQFRCAHQVPEILGQEANDHCERAIQLLDEGDVQRAVEHLQIMNPLVETIVRCLEPVIDNLSTLDYHRFRKNLGITSGSHSICLRFHMFNDLFEQLGRAASSTIEKFSPPGKTTTQSFADQVHRIEHARFQDPKSWNLHLLMTECLKFRSSIFLWRDQHLHLPRNHLGGNRTKSLSGAPDAVKTTQQLRNLAQDNDPMAGLAAAKGRQVKPILSNSPLKAHFQAMDSVDTKLLLATGAVTQSRFEDVQTRSGTFSQRCPFRPPTKRQV